MGITVYRYSSEGQEKYTGGKFESFSAKTNHNNKKKFCKIDKNSSHNSNSTKINEDYQQTKKGDRKSKFRSLLIENNFEPARNLTLEELTEETCKYMENNVHPDQPNATFCGRKTVSNSKQKFSYCPLHLMIIFQPKNKKEDVIDKDDEFPQFIEKRIKSA